MAISSLNAESALCAAFSSPVKALPIIDTHQHLVDFQRFGSEWSRPPVAGNFGIKEYKKATRGLNVVKAVYMEVAVPAHRRHEEALYAIELCKDPSAPTVAAVIKADLYDPGFSDYMSQFSGSPYIKGIRGSFRSREDMLNDQVVKNVRVLGVMNMSLDISLSPAWLSGLLKLVEACPDTRFLINHCGNVDPRAFILPENLFGAPDHDGREWATDMKALASHKNVVCKISGVVTRSPGYELNQDNLGPAINQCLDIFGPDRVMFAADWPWCLKTMDIRNWVDILKKVVAGRSDEDQRKLFYDNAARFYNI